MFKIQLSPIASTSKTQISVAGDVLTYDGADYDFSTIGEGQQVAAESQAIGIIRRENGVVHITMEYRYNSELAEPIQSADPADYIFDVDSGDCPDPIKYKPSNN